MADLFLNSESLADAEISTRIRHSIERDNVEFGFPNGFNEIRLIERLRLLEIIGDRNESEQNKFDFAYDIAMQKLSGKQVDVYWIDGKGRRNLAFSFEIIGRYMDLMQIRQLNKYPCIVQWLVHFMTGDELKKYPLSLEALTSESGEPMTKSRKK